jgi:hypothetical protein
VTVLINATLSKENFIFLEDIKYPSADQMSVELKSSK